MLWNCVTGARGRVLRCEWVPTARPWLAGRMGKKATKKDVLYSKKEINLEYRDEFGRLLTRKEAFRQLCYQFHGYGSGKKNQEKRLKKIKLENEAREKRINEDKGTMGSLRKTQQATGKAFVIHKT